MIKFIHKNHINKHTQTKDWVVYYSLSDIILGCFLVALVAFFIYKYLRLSLSTASPTLYNQSYSQNQVRHTKVMPLKQK